MPVCSKCSKQLPRGFTGILKTMQTGTYVHGGAFLRQMNVCSKCATEHEASQRAGKRQKLLLLLVAIVAVGAGGYWWFFARLQ